MRRRGFTFIEIMIAITVFAIGVLAVLRLLTSNLVTMDKTENRTIATFLAKEGIELVYNIRDANIQKGLPRNCLLADEIGRDISLSVGDQDISKLVTACSRYFSSGAVDGNGLSLGFSDSGYYIADTKEIKTNFAENFSNFGLVQKTGMVDQKSYSRYAPGQENETGDLQIFGRYILFTGVVENGNPLPLTDILKVESHVLFSKGASTGEIILESLIGKN